MSHATGSQDSDGAHLAGVAAQWQPPAPSEIKGCSRAIGDIVRCCTEDMRWLTLQSISRLYPNATLADIDWRGFISQVWRYALQEAVHISGVVQPADWHNEMHLETWQKILSACEIDTWRGLERYVRDWQASDPVVFGWMQGAAIQKPCADIGGWLADYCNTAFLVLSEQARPNVLYKVVENKLYRSLAELIGPFGMSAGKSGDVWEQLCWHAYEHSKCAFILAVVWNTTNRQLLPTASASSDGHPAEHGGLARQTAPVPNAAAPVPNPAEYGGLTLQEAQTLVAQGNPGSLHKAMRAHLQAVAHASEENPYGRRREVPLTLPWRAYIAFHPQRNRLIGPGIDCFYMYFMPEVDPNRAGQLRLNYVMERTDGTVVLLHPGRRASQDALPLFLNASEFQLRLGNE